MGKKTRSGEDKGKKTRSEEDKSTKKKERGKKTTIIIKYTIYYASRY